MEIRCEWTDRYPIDSCPTRVSNIVHITEYEEREETPTERNKRYELNRIKKLGIEAYRESKKGKRKVLEAKRKLAMLNNQ